MLPAPNDNALPPLLPGRRRAARHFRRRMAWLSVLAMVVATLVGAGASPATAEQATGDEVPAWSNGWSWTYTTVFNYNADGTNVSINENVTYTVAGVENFQGQPAYKLNLSGTITGGGGSVAVDGVGNATLSNFSGTVSGTRYMRRSDLALLKETQSQQLNAKAAVSIISTNISANISLSMDPRRGWRLTQFPTEAGNSWTNDVDVDYTGGFSYDAGSLGGTGSSDFAGALRLDDQTTVANENISVPAGTVSTRRARQSGSGTAATTWFSPTHRGIARLLLEIPMEGGSLTLDQKLGQASTPTPSTTLTSTVTPSISCAGGDLTVTGRLSSGAAGVPVTVALDKSPVTPGASQTVSTTTTSNGNYSATVQAPAEADGYQRTGVRGSWGVVVTAGGATSVATVLVTPRSCTALTYTGDTAAPQGTTATVAATLVDKTGASVSGRTVNFALAGGQTVTATTNASGVAQTTIAVNGPPRTANLVVSYAGNAGSEPASQTVPFTVGAIATTTTVTADPAVVTVGDPVRFHATVAPTHGANPGGSVQFRVDGSDFGAAVPLTDGEATSAALSTLGLGDHTVVAVYNGTADHAGSTSAAVVFRVREPLKPTSTTSSASPTTAVAGQPVTLGATVTTATGTPTGDVVFTVDGNEVARAAVAADGTASTTVTDLPVGSNAVVATYAGDDVYGPSSAAPRTVTVSKAAVEVTLSATSSSTVTGEAIGLTATVAVQAPGGGSPDGTVQLIVDGNPTGAPVDLVNGSASFPSLTSLSAGAHTLAVSYSGSARYLTGSDQLSQQVAKADTTTTLLASPSPSLQDQEVRLTATVAAVSPGSGSATGTVNFFAGSESIGSAPLVAGEAGSTATLDVSDLAPGVHQLTARFAGDGNYEASDSDEVSHTVIAATAVVTTSTTVTSSSNPSTYGELITFRAEVTTDSDTAPEGAVQFSVDGHDFGDPVEVGADGTAESATLASPDPGDHTVIAAFVPAPGFTGSGDVLVQTVEAAGVDLALSSTDADAQVGDQVRFRAEVSSQVVGAGDPTGFVQFAVDGVPLGDAVEIEDGVATSRAVSDLAPGTHTVTALYSGDVHFKPELAELEQSVSRVGTTTTLTVSPTTPTYGDQVQLTAQVQAANADLGTPTGTVTFLAGTVELGTAPVVDGQATLSTSVLVAGNHQLRAVYGGSAAHDGSSSAVRTVTVAKRATTLTADAALVSLSPLGLPLGQLRATVKAGGAPLAGVPVEFKVGNKVVCTTATAETGTATCNGGSQVLNLVLNGGYTATFLGDANHLSSTARGAILK
ncbi:Ig-like domain repeat protein [Nocardioides sp. J54]|uniref:Ig-like domain repeat protein n=1 Tax=Nocardioides sp. J54 TaxID=935866 RepID=UPI00048E2A45|nr:Ig-like domain repeat protein [Nocardioides sp. J54]